MEWQCSDLNTRNFDHKGHVISKTLPQEHPNCWDQELAPSNKDADNDKAAEETVWDNMERVSDTEDENSRAVKRKRTE